MADVEEPTACEACGRQLPPQHGKGRRKRYCDATCRSAARRARESGGTGLTIDVKSRLTTLSRQEYVDDVTQKPNAAALVAVRVGDAARRLAAELAGPGTGSALAAVAAASELSAAASAALQEAVDQARAAGHSWREIGDVLDTTRQAAFQRFGRPVDPRTGEPMNRTMVPDAGDRAAEIFGHLAAGHPSPRSASPTSGSTPLTARSTCPTPRCSRLRSHR